MVVTGGWAWLVGGVDGRAEVAHVAMILRSAWKRWN